MGSFDLAPREPRHQLRVGHRVRLAEAVQAQRAELADKRDVAKDGHFKIDVLSSRALAQLMEGVEGVYDGSSLPLDAPPFTPAMAAMLARGDNLGLTLAESPLCRAEFKAHAPTSVGDVAACLARIRPAARQSEGTIVYDDDAIRIVAEAVGCSTAEADGLRRGLAKRDPATASALRARLGASVYAALEAQADEAVHARRINLPVPTFGGLAERCAE
jgi:DNA polymerase III alpha subunit